MTAYDRYGTFRNAYEMNLSFRREKKSSDSIGTSGFSRFRVGALSVFLVSVGTYGRLF